MKKLKIVIALIVLIIIIAGVTVFFKTDKKSEHIVTFGNELQMLIDDQQNNGTRSIMKTNCEELKSVEAKNYCQEQQTMINNLLK